MTTVNDRFGLKILVDLWSLNSTSAACDQACRQVYREASTSPGRWSLMT